MKKAIFVLVGATVAFILIIAGIYIGRKSTDGSIAVFTQKSVKEEIYTTEETHPNMLININNASAEELETLPGIGSSTAQNIIDYRNAHGPFLNIKDIMKVKGIGESIFNDIKSMICVKD